MIVSARGYARPGNDFGDGAIIAFSGIDGIELWCEYGNPGETMGNYGIELISDLNGDGLPELAATSGSNASIWLSCDSVSVIECPEPGQMAILLPGIGLLLLIDRRRRRLQAP